jgi:Domain of unknown function (DUF4276)
MATVYPIVEGHGDVEAVPLLLRRIAFELLELPNFVCLRPTRLPRGKLKNTRDLENAVQLGRSKLRDRYGPHLILILMDADDDCPVALRAALAKQHSTLFSANNVSMVFVVREYEAWFLAANLDRSHHAELRVTTPIHPDPEAKRNPKAEFETNFLNENRIYKETADQPKFTSVMDLTLAQARAPSFDKLVRDLKAGLMPT